ncbi:Protein of unknown function [Gryllus bimaculatus]|nr:Protein of unknown function [Gryllus bimaculatus]
MFEALLLAARRTPRRPRRATPAGADAGVDSGVSTASLADSADADAKSDVVADAAAERKGSRAREGEGEEEEEKKDELPPTPAGSPPARLRRMLLYFRQPGRSSLPRDASSAAWQGNLGLQKHNGKSIQIVLTFKRCMGDADIASEFLYKKNQGKCPAIVLPNEKWKD